MTLRKVFQVFLLVALVIGLIGVYTLFSQTPLLQAEESKNRLAIGYVDIPLIFEQHPEKFKAEQILSEEARRLQALLEEEAEDLDSQEQKDLLERYQMELMLKERELVLAVVGEIEKIVEQVAIEAEIEVVLERQNVIYGGYNLTQAVLEKIREAGSLD